MRKRIYVDKDLREEQPTRDYAFPLYVTEDSLFNYEHNMLSCHWHSDLEITIVIKGEMEYHINDKVFIAGEGTCLMANANALHFAIPVNGEDCSYNAVIFNPQIIYGYEGSAIEQRYISSVLHNPNLDAVLFTTEIPWQQEILSAVSRVVKLYQEKAIGYELLIASEMCRFWSLLYANLDVGEKGEIQTSIATLKDILSFIHANYNKKLTLAQIAGAGNISRGECCRLFQKTLKQSPFAYLHYYRIQKSLPLLTQGERNITEISENVGFNGVSYFSEVFKKIMHCTPRDYKKRSV